MEIRSRQLLPGEELLLEGGEAWFPFLSAPYWQYRGETIKKYTPIYQKQQTSIPYLPSHPSVSQLSSEK